MKINANTHIIGQNVILVPYRDYHVPKYHEWMKSQELQELTASEPLTLEEEYKMQKTWQEDEDKCTFIVLKNEDYIHSTEEIDLMIGDTNIFITNKEEGIGEIEIMIAEPSARRKKLGLEAVTLMLLYGIKKIKIKIFEAKISMSNVPSQKLFEKLGFTEKLRSEVFQEITYEKIITKKWCQWLENQVVNFEIQNIVLFF